MQFIPYGVADETCADPAARPGNRVDRMEQVNNARMFSDELRNTCESVHLDILTFFHSARSPLAIQESMVSVDRSAPVPISCIDVSTLRSLARGGHGEHDGINEERRSGKP